MKRCIAWLLAAVYLFAVGAPAYVAVTCECVAVVSGTHVCCYHCEHNDGAVNGKACMEAPCCGDQHSTDISLYVVSSQDGDKQVKRLVAADLPPALAAGLLLSSDDPLPTECGRVVIEGAGAVPDAQVAACGLRAPPVLV